MRRRNIVGWLAVGAVALVGCTGPGEDGPVPATSASARDAEPELLWSVQDVTLLGPPEVADGVAVGYVTTGRAVLQLRGWDVETGEELWSDTASPGGGPPGAYLSLATLEVDGTTYVATQMMRRGTEHGVIVRRLPDGDVIALDNQVAPGTDLTFDSGSRLWGCEDERAFCVESGLYDAPTTTLRIDPVAATVTALPPEASGLPANARNTAALWATNDRPPTGTETLGRSKDGVVLWSRGYEELFGPGASSDGGWTWEVHDQTDDVIGTVSLGWQDEVLDRTRDIVVALDGDTGNLLWRQDGVTTHCNAYFGDGDEDLWCRVRAGTIDFTGDGTTLVGPTDITVEKFDPTTGAVLWSAPIGDAPGLLDEGRAYLPADDSMVFASGDGAVRIQLDDGTVTPVDDDEVLACMKYPAFEYYAYGDRTRPTVEYLGQPTADLCHADGAPATGMTTEILEEFGVDAGDGIVLLAVGEGVNGYRMP